MQTARHWLILTALLALAACHKPAAGGEANAPDPAEQDVVLAAPDVVSDDDATDLMTGVDGADAAADVSPADAVMASDAAAPAPNVLFIGNSYTFVNDLPTMTVLFAQAGGVTLQQTSVTQGGATLAVLIAQTQAVAMIAQGGWTHVVLQGQSLEPAFDVASFLASAHVLADDAHKAGAAVSFYQTWPRKVGDAVYQEPMAGGSPQSLAQLLHDGYEKAAQQNGGVRVPVGDAWMLTLAQHPEIALYQADGSHPLVSGTYLAACVFSATLFAVQPEKVTWVPDGLDAKQASALRAMCRAATALK